MYKKIVTAAFLALLLSACSGNIQTSTPDEIFDAVDGTSNLANDPDSDL